MKKSILTLCLVLVAAFAAQAQQALQQTVEVNASVIAKLAIVSTQDVEVGTIVTSEPSVLPANGNDAATVTNAGVNAAPGQIIVSGAAGERISVSFSNATLANPTGGIATFSPSVYESATSVTSGDEVTFIAGSGNSGQITLDIGGTLSAIADGDEGDYSTTNAGGTPIEFTFTYTSI